VTLPPGYPNPSTALRVEAPQARLSTEIAANGMFEFTHVMPGTYSLAVRAPGAQPFNLVVADRDITGIELSVPPLIAVRGTVTLEGSGPRPRFSLQIEGLLPAGATLLPAPYRTVVNATLDGAFSAALPPGEYRLLINNLPGGFYLKSIAAGATDFVGKSFKIAATDSPVRIAITIGISAGVRVTGRVTGVDTASPLPGKIMLTGVAVSDSVEAPLNADGSFQIEKVTPGTYNVRVAITSSISSPTVVVVIPNRNVTDFNVSVPTPRVVLGRVAVDGNGPPPKFSLLLIRGASVPLEAALHGQLPTVSPSNIMNAIVGGISGSQVLQVDINALPDGSFRMKVPDGEYRVAAIPAGLSPSARGIPGSYFLRSLTANSSDLMTEPLRISEMESQEIHAGFGTTAPNPWVKLSGRVKGLDPAKNVLRVTLESNSTSTIETVVDSDGKFEFPAVLQANNYIARLIPADEGASSPRITVAGKDVSGVEIVVPRRREITGSAIVEGNNPVPGFGLTLAGAHSSMDLVIRPDADGTFKVSVPDDSRTVRISGLPFGYKVQSLTYGSTDLMEPIRPVTGPTSNTLKIAELPAAELKVTFAVDANIPWGSLRGRVTGLDPNAGSVGIVLSGVAAFTTFETSVSADGSFNFLKIPQGTYIPSLQGAIVASRLTPYTIVVSGSDLSGIEIAAPSPDASTQADNIEEPRIGATVSDFGPGARTVNDTAAVANLRTINTALVVYLSSSGGKYGNLDDLIGAGILDGRFRGTMSGFNYSVITDGREYAAAAVPANWSTGRFGYYSSPDAVIRYSTFDLLAPPQQTGKAVQ
jgi:hypothetical protein